MKYSEMNDDELIHKLRAGEENILDIILEKYKPLVKKEAKRLFLFGGENDDLIQEGMIGLFKAVQDYHIDNEGSFKTFAKLCIDRNMYSAIKASNRKKHKPLNSYISMDFYDEITESYNYTEISGGKNIDYSDPEELYIIRESSESLFNEMMDYLSPFEKEVFLKHIGGMKYMEIATEMDMEPKRIENTIYRLKKKVKQKLNTSGTKVFKKG